MTTVHNLDLQIIIISRAAITVTISDAVAVSTLIYFLSWFMFNHIAEEKVYK